MEDDRCSGKGTLHIFSQRQEVGAAVQWRGERSGTGTYGIALPQNTVEI